MTSRPEDLDPDGIPTMPMFDGLCEEECPSCSPEQPRDTLPGGHEPIAEEGVEPEPWQ